MIKKINIKLIINYIIIESMKRLLLVEDAGAIEEGITVLFEPLLLLELLFPLGTGFTGVLELEF